MIDPKSEFSGLSSKACGCSLFFIILGCGSFVLPLFGRQFRLLSSLADDLGISNVAAGFLMLGVALVLAIIAALPSLIPRHTFAETAIPSHRPRDSMPDPVAVEALDVWRRLQRARQAAEADQLTEAEAELELCLGAHPGSAQFVAGESVHSGATGEPSPSGYALLVHKAAALGRKDLALRYIARMIDLLPGSRDNAILAAQGIGMEDDARALFRDRGIAWRAPTP